MSAEGSKKLLFIGRLLIAGVFAFMGLYKVLNWGATAGWMAYKGLTLIPILLVGAIVVELGGGLMLAFGYRTRLVAFLLTLFLVPTNLIFHNFWALPPQEASQELLSFLQNLAVMGGLFAIAAAAKGTAENR